MDRADPGTAQQIVPHRAERSCRLVAWQPWPFENPALIGHATIGFAGGWVVHSVPVFRGHDGLGVGVPNAAVLDRDGRIKERDGKRQYTALLSFETRDAKERWRHLVLGALAAAGITASSQQHGLAHEPVEP